LIFNNIRSKGLAEGNEKIKGEKKEQWEKEEIERW
jgi:hypothetical protein